MRTYNPNFIWWKDPQPEILLKVYVFNITNSEEFIAGRDKKLKLQEVGPIVFQELTVNRDIVHHEENSTMSYTVSRRLVFKESANIEGILNQTVYVPNMALSGASYTSNNFFLRRPFNILLKSYATKPIVAATVYEYLFNMTDPVL
jgi:scavenger receptor class B protein 1